MADKKSKSKIIDQAVIDANEENMKKERAAEKANHEREAKINAEVATRTSRFDQDLKERARAVGINPDNFAEEHILGKAVAEAEASQTNQVEDK